MGATKPADGETEAFLRRMSDAYREPLIRFFRRRTGGAAEAEDLTQEVFLRLLRRPDGEAIDNPEAFLFRTAVNLLRDRARRAGAFAAHAAELAERQDRVEGLSPERVLEGRQSLAAAMRILEELDERVRDAFILHRLEGLKYAEIAELFGVSVSSVEKYVIKALAHLARRAGRI
ncbi:MAG: sigma-70 family RNA polymerase sigma factor [Caulobacterales bacterium]|nr:sigma-70 family RNA polymerase sigma factor [Caulobacterales bacterium]